jgi:carbonic anhydrase
MTKAQRDQLSPDQIIGLMKQGNERFRKGGTPARNYIAQQKATANDQHPATVILSCIDSRAPAEIIMDLGIGDISTPVWPAISRTTTSLAAWSSPAMWPERKSYS